MTTTLNRILDYMLNVFAVGAGVVLIYIWLTVNYDVIMRYFFNRPTEWAVDFNMIALIYFTFLGVAWVLQREGHVKIEVLLDRLSPKAKRIINTITSVVGIVLAGLLFWYGIEITEHAIRTTEWHVSGIIIPRWPIFIPIPIGSFLLVLQFIRRAWLYATGRKIPEKKAAEEGLAPV